MEIKETSLSNLVKWEKGQSGNPAGRPKGSRNLLAESFIAALHKDFQEFGMDAVIECRENKPDIYLRVIASIIPKELTLHEGETAIERILDTIADDQLAEFVEGVRLLTAAAQGGKEVKTPRARKEPSRVH